MTHRVFVFSLWDVPSADTNLPGGSRNRKGQTRGKIHARYLGVWMRRIAFALALFVVVACGPRTFDGMVLYCGGNAVNHPHASPLIQDHECTDDELTRVWGSGSWPPSWWP